MNRLCLLCKNSHDVTSLTRVPIRAEGEVIGALLVCADCIEAVGVEQLKVLMQTAIDEKSYPPESFLSAEAPESMEPPNPAVQTNVEIVLEREVLADAEQLASRIGLGLSTLLLGQYREGRGKVQLATSLVPEGEQFRFRAGLLPD